MMMYPRYSYSDVLDELAFIFFSLLNEGYRLQSQRYIMLANIASVPHMESADRTGFLRQLEWSSKAPGDILEQDNGEQDMAGVRNLFGKV